MKKGKQWSELNINPVWGCYNNRIHGGPCWYCYASDSAKKANMRRTKVGPCNLCDQFVPHAHPHLTPELRKITPGQEPKFVFVDGHFDWNGKRVRKQWLEAILERMKQCPQHNFVILSKFPHRYSRFGLKFPTNTIVGCTCTNEGRHTLPEMTDPFNATANLTLQDWRRIDVIRRYKIKNRKAVSFEPLLGPLPPDVSLKGIDWVIIGALSIERLDQFGSTIDRNRYVQPKREWVEDIVARAEGKVWMKKTLRDFKPKDRIQEYP